MRAADGAEVAPGAAPEQDHGASCGGPLAGDLGWALGTLFRAYVQAAGDAVADLDLPGGPRGYQVLAASRGEPPTQVMLAQHLGVDRTVMTYLLDDLVAAGLVERRTDPSDRRARRIAATTTGRALLGRLDRRLRTAEDRVLATLGDEDRERFRDLLRRLATDAGAAAPTEVAETAEEAACDVTPDLGEAPRRRPAARRRARGGAAR